LQEIKEKKNSNKKNISLNVDLRLKKVLS
jgi:hypothetical protein